MVSIFVRFFQNRISRNLFFIAFSKIESFCVYSIGKTLNNVQKNMLEGNQLAVANKALHKSLEEPARRLLDVADYEVF